MKNVNNPNDLVVHADRRAKYLADRPAKGDVMYRDGKPVKVIGLNDFDFEVKIQGADGLESVPFDELTRES
jgi:hypothetical protein